ncbi:isoprenylcysteine carboxylmethyltransferase family protein [bacterium]|nr:isoprenylcysteine carboxylmethyltransferase family protein [bacterium]
MRTQSRINLWIPVKVAGTVMLICLACDGLVYLLNIPTIFSLLPDIPNWVFTFVGWLHVALGGLLFVSGLIRLGFRAAAGAPADLITDGPFRYVRSPMYGGLAYIIAGCGLAFGQISLLLAAVMWLLVARHYCMDEERMLARLFGRTYTRYRNTTPLLIPHLGRILADFFNVRRPIL